MSLPVFLLSGFDLVVCGFNEVEDYFSICDIDGGLSEFVVERGIVEQVEVAQQQQSRILVIGIEREQAAEIVDGLAVEELRMLYVLRYVHDGYQLATVALKIWSVRSSHICCTSSC